MSLLNEESGRGWTCHFKDGTNKTNLTYLESLIIFDESLKTDNPCSVTPPGAHSKDAYKAP